MSKGISLDRFAKGMLSAVFNREVEKVASNIYDPNTSSVAKRTITITLEIKPDENRELGNVDISVKSKICPVKSVSTKLLLGYDETKKVGIANEFKAEMLDQMSLGDLENETLEQEEESESDKNILDFRKNKN